MGKKTTVILSIIIVVLVFLAIASNYILSEVYSFSGNPIKRVYLKNAVVKAETVTDSEKIEQGLAGRKDLSVGRGMLFMMPEEDYLRFWMKGMQFPIDIIWIENNLVIGCERNISPKDDRIFISPEKAGFVLEVPAGFCDQYDVQINDAVKI
jgi:uncharacterized protein